MAQALNCVALYVRVQPLALGSVDLGKLAVSDDSTATSEPPLVQCAKIRLGGIIASKDPRSFFCVGGTYGGLLKRMLRNQGSLSEVSRRVALQTMLDSGCFEGDSLEAGLWLINY